MSHEISRILRMVGGSTWFIEPRRAEEIIEALLFRAEHGPRAEPMFPEKVAAALEANDGGVGGTVQGGVKVLRLWGVIAPRASPTDMSGPGVASLTQFQQAFTAAADDPNLRAIIIDVDSPGGRVDQVPETAAMIRSARRADRPIIAVANTVMASAAYWVASAADELVATPSATVGSIGVYTIHKDVAEKAKAEGINITFVADGPRKTENNPFGPMTEEGFAALQSEVSAMYGLFVSDVAKGRGVPQSVVRADPEKAENHFGGGRAYGAALAAKLGLVDKVATLQETIARAAGQKKSTNDVRRKRMALNT